MPRAKTKPDIPEDRLFQERFWTIERGAWIAFVLLLLAAVAGLFGSGGPLSTGSRYLDGSLVEHPAIARWQAGDQISILLGGGAGERRLTLSSEFAETFRIDDLQPPPDRMEAVEGGHVYVFATRSDALLAIHVAVTPRHPGYSEYTVAVGNARARLSTFVWP